jgi:hypothetical protein
MKDLHVKMESLMSADDVELLVGEVELLVGGGSLTIFM